VHVHADFRVLRLELAQQRRDQVMPTEYGTVKRSQPRGPDCSWLTALSACSSSRAMRWQCS